MVQLILFILFGMSVPLGCLFVGGWLLRLFIPSLIHIPLVCRVGLGLIVLTFLLILCGVLGLYSRPVLQGIEGLWLLAGMGGLWQISQEPFFTDTVPETDPGWNPLFLRIGIAVMLFLCLINTMTPETRHDPYDYHLTIPTLYLAHHAIVEIPWHVFSYMPKACEMLYGLALSVGEDCMCKLLHLLFGGLCILTIATFIKNIAGHEAALLSALLVTTLPLFGFLATSSYIDLARAFWELAALYLLYQVGREKDVSSKMVYILISGLFAGMALSTKYVSWVVFMPAYLLLWILTVWRLFIYHGIKPFLWAVPAWVSCIMLPVVPWLIYNYLWTGNPVYPLFPSLFGLHTPAAEQAYQFIRNHAPAAENLQLHTITGYVLKRIGNLVLEGNALVFIGAIAWLLSPWWKRHSIGTCLPSYAYRGILIYTILSTGFFLVGSENMDGRFFFSTLALLSVPSVFLLFALSHSIQQSSPWGRYLIPGFALVLFMNAVTYRFNQIKDQNESPVPILTKNQRDQWLSRRFHYYGAIKWANEHLDENSLIIGMGYPLKYKHIARIKYGYIPFLQSLPPHPSPAELHRVLRENGVTHLVKPYLSEPGMVDFSILEPDYLIPLYSYRGITIFQLAE